MDIILELGKFFISTTVLGGVMVWIFKEFLRLKFSKDLENFKGEIDNHFYQEKLKYSKIYEERAIIVKELYKILNKYHKQLRRNYKAILELTDLKEQDINKSFDLGSAFEDYFDNNRILLSEDLCKKIEKLKKTHLEILKKILINELMSLSSKEMKKEVELAKFELGNLIDFDIPSIEKQLEEEFRKMLGSIK